MTPDLNSSPAFAPTSRFRGKFDACCGRFEAAWRSGVPPRIEDYVVGEAQAGAAESARALLIELVMIDLVYRWRPAEKQETIDFTGTASTIQHAGGEGGAAASAVQALRLDEYVARYPVLGPVADLPDELIAQEYRARRLAGVRPEHEECLARFGSHRPGLEGLLLEIDRQVSSKPDPSQARPMKPRLLGKFELLDRLGEGGCGTVYKARDRDLNRTVALKVPRSGSFHSDDERQRFVREARSAAGFRHPAICPVYEAGEQEGQAYIAMGYIAGKTLGVWAAERGISAREAAQIVAKVARAVQYAHEKGVIHRDIKPGNVMIDAESGEPILMDFGLAKELSDRGEALTHTGDVMGTPAYMAPEQAAGRKDQMGPATDVYALGAVLYELVAGRPPFQGTVGEVLMKVQSEEAAPLSKVAPRVHRDLETICAKALAAVPADRYASAAALADDLERFQAGEAILARREGPIRKLVRRIRRRPAFSAFLAAAVLIVLGALAFAWRGMEVHRVSSLMASIEAKLGEGPWEQAALEEVEVLIAELEPHDADRAAEAQQRLYKGLAEFIGQRIRQPRLETSEVDRIQQALALLESRQPEPVPELQRLLRGRLAIWEPVCELAAPFANAGEVFDLGQVKADAGALQPQQADAGQPAVLSSKVQCGANVRLEATLEGPWDAVPTVGLLLRGSGTDGREQGYEFALRHAEKTAEAKPAREGPAPEKLAYRAQILRNGAVLQEQSVAAADLSGKPLRWSATRQEGKLAVKLNELPALEFEDIFPLVGDAAHTLALRWPAAVKLQRLKVTQRAVPAAASPLELGDAAYAEGKHAEAMEHFEAIAHQPATAPAVAQEAHFKAGLAMLALGQRDEAAKVFRQLTTETGDRWPLLAACHIWLIRIEQQAMEEADLILERISSHVRFEQLATLLPQQSKERIYRAYWVSGVDAVNSRFRYDPQRIRRLERALQAARLLNRGAEIDWAQQSLAEGYLFGGDRRRALEILRRLIDEKRFARAVQIYARSMHSGGDPYAGLTEIDAFLSGTHGSPLDRAYLTLERARIHAALGKDRESERDLREVLESKPLTEFDQVLHTGVFFLWGFLHARQGNEPAAREAWRTVLPRIRAAIDKRADAINGTIYADFLVMATLVDELTPTDVQRMMGIYLGTGDSGSVLAFIRSMVSPDVITSVFREMWKTPRGRECAESLALRGMSADEHVARPIALAATEFIRQQAFSGELLDDQDAQVWQICQAMYTATLRSNRVNPIQLGQLAAAWKGVSNWLGWGSVAPTLDPSLRGGIAYVLGHRYIRLGKTQEAAAFFEQAKKDAASGSSLATLAQTDLELLKSKRGQLLVESDFPGSLQLAVQQDGKEIARLDLPARPTLDLAAGNYRLSLVNPPADVALSSDQVALTPAARQRVRAAWLWKPGSRDHALPGLLPRPARLPNLGRWQIELAAPRGPVYGVSWSSDGRWVSCATGNVVRVYEFPGLRPVRLFLGHGKPAFTTAIQPQGVRLASTALSGPARLWDVTTGIPGPILDDGSGGNRSASWSPDGQRLVLAGERSNQSPSLWNADGSLIKVCSGHASVATSAGWNPDGSTFASVGEDGTLRLWSREGVASRVIEIHSKDKPPSWPHLLAWGAGARWLAISAVPETGAIQLWDTATWKPGPVFRDSNLRFNSLAWSPDGKRLATAGYGDSAPRLWDVEGKAHRRLDSHANNAYSVAWEPTGKRIAIGGDNGTLRFCDPADDAPAPVLGDHRVPIGDLVASRDGKWLASRGHDETVVRLWNADGRPGPVLKGHTGQVIPIAWSPDGTRLATGAADKTIRLWTPPSSEAIKVLTGHSDMLLAISWSPDGKTLVSAGADRTIRLWKTDDGSTVKVLPVDKSGPPVEVEWSPDGKRFARTRRWVESDTALQIFSADGTPGPVLKGGVEWAAWSPDGNSIACGCVDKMVRVLAASDGRVEREMKGHTACVWHLAWSPDGKFLASCGAWGDAQPRLWHADGQPAPAAWPPDQYTTVVWDPTGKRLALASYGGEIRLWDVAQNQAGPVLAGHLGPHQRIAWAPDGRHLMSTSSDNTLRRWDTTTGDLMSVTLPLPNGQAAYLSPGGKLEVTSPEVERELVYIVEQPNGEQKLFSPAEFRRLIGPRQISPVGGGKP